MPQKLPVINPNALIPYVGMYSIPARLLGEVVKRGCNCVFHSETDDGKVNQADWRFACREAGLGYFDFPSANLDADAADPFLFGWIIRDSDEWNRKRGTQSTLTNPAAFIAEANRLQSFNVGQAASGNRTVPVCANADGPSVTTAIYEKPPYNGVANNERRLMRRLNGRFVDWYPAVNTAANTPSEVARRPDYLPAQAVQRMFDWMADEWASYMPGVGEAMVSPGEAWYGVIMEANTPSNKPVAVTPARMRAQIDYVLGRSPFSYPADPKFSGKTVVQKIIDVRVRVKIDWTANGSDGPSWKWIAQTDAQAQMQLDINRELLGTPTPAPPIDPPPVVVVPPPVITPVDPVVQLRADFEAFVKGVGQSFDVLTDSGNLAHARLDNIAHYAGRPAVGMTKEQRLSVTAHDPRQRGSDDVLVGDDAPWFPAE